MKNWIKAIALIITAIAAFLIGLLALISIGPKTVLGMVVVLGLLFFLGIAVSCTKYNLDKRDRKKKYEAAEINRRKDLVKQTIRKCNRGNLCPWTKGDPSYCKRCGIRAQGSCQG